MGYLLHQCLARRQLSGQPDIVAVKNDVRHTTASLPAVNVCHGRYVAIDECVTSSLLSVTET